MRKITPIEEILKGLHPTFQTAKIKNKLFESGLKENRCEECGITEWNNRPLVMHLDHINGKSDDHRFENLRILCPNCHSQTETYAGKNKTNEHRLSIAKKKQDRLNKIEANKKNKKDKLDQRIELIKTIPKTWGWIARASEKLNLSHTQVRRLVKKYLPEIQI